MPEELWMKVYNIVHEAAIKTIPKSNMETYITICKIDSQREFAVWLRKLKQGLCINLEGWDGEEDEREFQKGGDICISMSDSC